MIKLLFVDTETTSVVNLRTPYNEQTLKEVWPYITQIAWSIAEFDDDLKNYNIIKSCSYFIKPTFEESLYDKDAMETTGIHYDFLLKKGVPSSEVLKEFFDDLATVKAVVAHNSTFDMKIIKAEVLRLGWDNHMRICPWIDTMYQSISFVGLKTSSGRPKFPTLTELYQRLYGHIQDSAHSANADVDTLIKCFHGLCTVPFRNKFSFEEEPIMNPRHFKAIQDKFNTTTRV